MMKLHAVGKRLKYQRHPMMGKTIMETISGRFNFMSYKVITFILKMATINRNFTAPKAGRINRQLDVTEHSYIVALGR